MAVGEEKRLISRELVGTGGRGGGVRDGGNGWGTRRGKGAELGEREQEKFTGEWVDATRPSNRRLDYSAQHIGRVCVYVCTYVCVRFSSCILLGARNIVYLYTPFALSPSPSSLYRSLVFSFFSSSFLRSVPEEQIAVPGSRVARVRKRVSDG